MSLAFPLCQSPGNQEDKKVSYFFTVYSNPQAIQLHDYNHKLKTV